MVRPRGDGDQTTVLRCHQEVKVLCKQFGRSTERISRTFEKGSLRVRGKEKYMCESKTENENEREFKGGKISDLHKWEP